LNLRSITIMLPKLRDVRGHDSLVLQSSSGLHRVRPMASAHAISGYAGEE
jgi:hypothetical protein